MPKVRTCPIGETGQIIDVPRGKILMVDGDTGKRLIIQKQKVVIPEPPGVELDRAMCVAAELPGFIVNYIFEQYT